MAKEATRRQSHSNRIPGLPAPWCRRAWREHAISSVMMHGTGLQHTCSARLIWIHSSMRSSGVGTRLDELHDVFGLIK